MSAMQLNKQKLIKSVLMFVLYAGIIAWLVAYISKNTEIVDHIIHANPRYVFACAVICFIMLVLSALLDVTCSEVYGIKINPYESTALTFIASAINQTLPLQAGSVVKAYYFKKMLSLSYSRYFSIVAGTIVVNLIVTFVQLIVCLAFLAVEWGLNFSYVAVLMLILCCGLLCLWAMVKYRDGVLKIMPFKKFSLPIMESFFALMKDGKAMFYVTLNLAATALLGGLRFYFIFKILGLNAGIASAMLYCGIYTATTVIPILPGNIGFSEAVIGIMNKSLGFDFSVGVAAVMVTRVYFYIVAVIGALLAIYPVWRKFNSRERSVNS